MLAVFSLKPQNHFIVVTMFFYERVSIDAFIQRQVAIHNRWKFSSRFARKKIVFDIQHAVDLS